MEDNEDEVVTEQDLESFRSQWRQELHPVQEEVSLDEQAKRLFLEGVDFEKKGKCFDAIRYYRRAIQLDPDIEFKAYRDLTQQKATKIDERNKINKSKLSEVPSSSSSSQDEIEDLVECFQRDLSISNRLCEPSFGPDVVTTSLHMSSLPFEIFINILKWIVSNDLDLKSLENFGMVCKGFFLLARDQEIWKLACIKVWGSNISPPSTTWRDMFISRPRVRFDGCYISKINYERLGENSFQDQFYRPVQIVEYFRLIRFLSDGSLLMLTSADDLQSSVNRMKNTFAAIQSKDILTGHYSYQDSALLVIIKKPRNSTVKFRRQGIVESDDFTFFLEVEIQSTSARKKYNKLMWKHYSISQFRGGEEITSEFDLRSSTKYPSFYFSPVKSFLAETKECLQIC